MNPNTLFSKRLIVEVEDFTPDGQCPGCSNLRNQLIAAADIASGALKGEQRYRNGYMLLQTAYIHALQISDERQIRLREKIIELKKLETNFSLYKSQHS